MDAHDLEIQGHRGARGLAPENTLEGFRAALAIGVHTLELDVGMSRDEVVVVHHDLTLNPDTTRDREGRWIPLDLRTPIHDLTLAELQALNVGAIRPGSEYASRFPDQASLHVARIPTLAAVAVLLQEPRARTIRLNVEVKVDPLAPDLTPPPERFADAVVKVLRDGGVSSRAAIQSFDWRVPGQVRRRAPDIATAYLTSRHAGEDTVSSRNGAASSWTAGLRLDEHGGSVPDMVHAAGGSTWSPDHHDLDARSRDRARELGLRVVVWTVNTREDIRRALDLGVDGIISDYPDRVREEAAAHGLSLPDVVRRSG